MLLDTSGREFCEVANAYRAGVMARVHDNSGILKGKMKSTDVIAKDDHRKFRDDSWKVYGLQKLEKVRPYAERHGMSVHQLACKWLLQQPALTTITATLLNEEEIAPQVTLNSVVTEGVGPRELQKNK